MAAARNCSPCHCDLPYDCRTRIKEEAKEEISTMEGGTCVNEGLRREAGVSAMAVCKEGMRSHDEHG